MSGIYSIVNSNVIGGNSRNIQLSNSRIFSSRIDMGNRVITNLAEPIDGNDSVNKVYVDRQSDRIAEEVSEQFSGEIFDLFDTNPVSIGDLRVGSYIVAVNPVKDGNSSGVFAVTKSSIYQPAFINQMTRTPDINTGEMINLQWPSGSPLLLYKSLPGNSSYLVSMNVKNLSGVPTETILPSDVASKAYVDSAIAQYLQQNFGGIKVSLTGDTFQNVANLQCGTYFVTVSGLLITNSPTASFIVSKNTSTADAHIVKQTSLFGLGSHEELDLVWKPNEVMKLRKSGPFYDGVYVCDFNLKNFSSAPLTNLPSDVVTLDALENAIQMQMNAKFGGISIQLTGTAFTDVANMRAGTYIITVNPTITNAPTASFAVSKSKISKDAHIVRMSNMEGSCSFQEQNFIEIRWPANENLQCRKTSDESDAVYIVDTNMKNLGTPIPMIPTDIASVEWVEDAINTRMNKKWGGVVVQLTSNLFSVIATPRLGSFLITISPLDNYGPTASFLVSKSLPNVKAHVVRISFCAGKRLESLELQWEANCQLLLRKTDPVGFNDGKFLCDFSIQNFSSAPEPILPSDLVTRDYLEQRITEEMTAKFSGTVVNLQNMEFTEVAALQSGAYIITVSPLGFPGPCLTASVSKNAQSSTGNIVVISNVLGHETGESLELLWPSNSKLLLRKNGIFHIGSYCVNYNLKNFSTTPTPVLPSDICTLEAMKEFVKKETDVKFGGIAVYLNGTIFSKVAPLRSGSYFISVYSQEYGAPSACFMASKSRDVDIGHIVKMTQSAGHCTKEELNMTWGSNELLSMNKSGQFYNANYIVSFSLQNFTVGTPAVLESETASREFVYQTYNDLLNTQFSGVPVFLQGDSFIEVMPLKTGSYMCSVSPKNQIGEYPTALFCISKSSNSKEAKIERLNSQEGEHKTELEMVWESNDILKLRKTSSVYCEAEYICDFNLRNIAIPPSQIESDIATKSFVDDLLNERLNIKYGGIVVNLQGDSFTQVCPLKVGSYTVNVSPLEDGGACSSFSISKSSQFLNAQVHRLTGMKGDFNETLELTWPSNSKLLLRKDVRGNAKYRVDFNLVNFSDTPRINENIGSSRSTLRIFLENDTFYDLTELNIGSYMIMVSPTQTGGSSCSFAVSKTDLDVSAEITRLTGLPGSIGEFIEITWLKAVVKIRKTVSSNDQIYSVKII